MKTARDRETRGLLLLQLLETVRENNPCTLSSRLLLPAATKYRLIISHLSILNLTSEQRHQPNLQADLNACPQTSPLHPRLENMIARRLQEMPG